MGFLTSAVGSKEEKVTRVSFTSTDVGPLEEWYARNGYALGGLGSFDSFTGQAVNEKTSLEAAGVYACLKVLGEDIGSLPFFTLRRNGSSVERAENHWLWATLHGMVNPEMASGEFVEGMTATAALHGDAVAWKQPWSRGGEKFYLWPWAAESVNITQTTKGRNVYEVAQRGNGNRTYQADEVFHLKGFSFTGWRGDDTLERARRLIGLTLTAQEYAGRHFKNGVHSDLFFTHPGELNDDGVRAVQRGFKAKMGSEHAGDPFVLRDGMTVERHSPDMRKQQLLDARKFQIVEICRIFRIQPHKLADLDRATFNNIEELQIDHVTNTLRHWVRRWREAVHRNLLTERERREGSIFAEHNVEALQRGDFRNQTDGFAKMLEKGVYSVNEVRRFLNINPVDGGDKHFIQMNMQQIAEAAKEATVAVLRELKEIAVGERREALSETIARLEAANG